MSVSNAGAQANGISRSPSVSADGRLVAFPSTSSLADDAISLAHIFVRDTISNTTTRVSVAPDGTPADGASIAARVSADGRFVAFSSTATNLVAGDTATMQRVFLRDLEASTTTRVDTSTAGVVGNGLSNGMAISADGSIIAFQSSATNLVPGDVNGLIDIFVRDRETGTTSRVSVSTRAPSRLPPRP